VFAFLLSLASVFGFPTQSSHGGMNPDDSERIVSVRRLYDAKQWEEAAREAKGPEDQSPELDYLAGMSLAHLERWAEARDAFSRGYRKAPRDKRFLLERAGAEYRLHDFKLAKNDLQAALRIDPHDSYSQDFLGTLFLLEGNLEAALKYWNPLGKPRLASVVLQPQPKLQEQLANRAVTFVAPEVLSRQSYLETNARLQNLGVFSSWRTEIVPSGQDMYEARVKLSERSDWGGNWVGGVLSLVSGVPYATVYPSYSNIGGEAANFESLARWDSEKRRFSANFSVPFFRNPARKVEFFFDARNENWNLSQTFRGSGVPITDLNLRRFAGGVVFHVVESGRWSWTSGFSMVSRGFHNVPAGMAPGATPFFTDGKSFEAWLELDRSLVRIPERRFTLDGAGEIRFGRGLVDNLGPFGSFRGALEARWLPRARGEDYETVVRLRGEEMAGDVPLDQLFELGVERDNDLWLRGHRATTNGRKGRAPLGRRYVLVNAEFEKNIYNNPLVRVQCGPFLDSGTIADPSGLFGSQRWQWDTGVQARIRLLGGVSVVLSYGWDLRSGSGTFYGTTAH
jgi:hypothetical protein